MIYACIIVVLAAFAVLVLACFVCDCLDMFNNKSF